MRRKSDIGPQLTPPQLSPHLTQEAADTCGAGIIRVAGSGEGGLVKKETYGNSRLGKGRPRRPARNYSCVRNYIDEEFAILLGFVEDIEPLEANEWALVAESFGEEVMKCELTSYKVYSIKKKFGMLAGAKKNW